MESRLIVLGWMFQDVELTCFDAFGDSSCRGVLAWRDFGLRSSLHLVVRTWEAAEDRCNHYADTLAIDICTLAAPARVLVFQKPQASTLAGSRGNRGCLHAHHCSLGETPNPPSRRRFSYGRSDDPLKLAIASSSITSIEN